MALSVWTERSGYRFDTIQERNIVNISLPAVNNNEISYSVISGKLPPGLRIVNNTIQGTPFEVPRSTDFEFVIRASNGTQIADRTFFLTVEGADQPVWQTAAGSLPIGPNNVYYILDSSYIDFQLLAIDTDTAAGQQLKYFIASKDGELPPGLVLTDSGRIVGWIQPALVIPASAGNGFFDTAVYDTVAFDFGYRSTNGYDSYVYDTSNFDYSTPSLSPKKLNRNYEFIVTITDGDTEVKRKFKIYVVGDDYFRADNTITTAGSGSFMVDATYVRAPIWVTPSNLGIRRANNYQTIRLDTYDDLDLGAIVYSLESTNPDSTPSVLPPGMQFDQGTAEVFGVIPYQPAITKTYKFTVSATRLSDRSETATSKRTFTVQVLGEIESVMSWVTESNLGNIEANLTSMLSIVASSTITESVILYVKTSGSLPPGLTLNLDGEITGKVPQFKINGDQGLLTFDGGTFSLDAGTTTLDRNYSFTVQARDILGYSAISKTFNLTVVTPNNRLYSNITAKPYLKLDQREMFKEFIRNSDVFDASAIYRPGDSNFGIQSDLKMIVYSGIETKTAAQVVSVVGQNHRKKRFKLGDIKTAQAKVPGTNTVVYEVIYIDVIDPLEIDGKTLELAIAEPIDPMAATVDQTNTYFNGPFDTPVRFWGRPQPYLVTADRNDVYPDEVFRQPSSISLWRKRIEQLGLHDRHYMPLWMRTIQDGSVQEIGFVNAVPLCFCKAGRSADIMLNIKNYLKVNTNFDFKLLDYTIDRYTIDSVSGDTTDKYIVFRNDRTIIT
jgi:hypothetical protein